MSSNTWGQQYNAINYAKRRKEESALHPLPPLRKPAMIYGLQKVALTQRKQAEMEMES